MFKIGGSFLLEAKDINLKKSFQENIQISKNHPDSALALFNDLYKKAIDTEDTTLAVQCLQKMSDLNLRLVQRIDAIENTGEALILSQALQDTVLQYENLNILSRVYRTYRKFDEALEYQKKALVLLKESVRSGNMKKIALIEGYHDMSLISISLKKFDSALMYIDSCKQISKEVNPNPLHFGNVLIAEARILIHQQKIKEAKSILMPLKEFYENHRAKGEYTNGELVPLIAIYSRLASIYEQDKPALAVKYYKKSIVTIDELQSQLGQKLFLYNRLSKIQFRLENYKAAYHSLRALKDLSEKWNSVKSSRNSDLVDVNNVYLKELERKEKELIKQKLSVAESEKSILRLRIILIVVFAMVSILGLYYLYRKMKRKQLETKKKSKEKDKHNKEVLELKNQELTSYTLLLIEKEEMLEKAGGILKKYPEDKEAKSLIRALKKGDTKIWEEFNQRFSSVNEGFYDTLREKYPELSSTNLKHCALIKLNFSSKEMAYLLGISERGVFTSRYRIRKKMNLDTEVNLTEFLNSI
ncbi:helix-turn-helix transcriptional regulator [Reichenbachiella versicolor]|uniref:helix-turn-helix transcriptional regulator n=1 Tax=Reichenbachiella versicolor TaxID=1821036 RepID=UPI000D6E8293|nr:hypothetical protein [Reichenbachiella versicolor]